MSVVALEAIDLNFDQPLEINESGDPEEATGWTDFAEYFAVGSRRFRPPIHVGQHYARPNHVLQVQTGLLDRPTGDGQTNLGLRVDVTGIHGLTVGTDRRCARHGQERAASHCS